jgi:hypothetical protein
MISVPSFVPDNPLNLISSVDPKNPFNPINSVDPSYPANPINRSNPNTPFNLKTAVEVVENEQSQNISTI